MKINYSLVLLVEFFANFDTNLSTSLQIFPFLILLAMVFLIQFWVLHLKTKRALKRYKEQLAQKETFLSDATLQLMDPMALIFGALHNLEINAQGNQSGLLKLLKKNFQSLLDRTFNLHIASWLDEQVKEPIFTRGEMYAVINKYIYDNQYIANEEGKNLVLHTTFQSCSMEFEADIFEQIFYHFLQLVISTSEPGLVEIEASINAGEKDAGLQKWLEPNKQYLMVRRKLLGEKEGTNNFSALEDKDRMFFLMQSRGKIEHLSLYIMDYLLHKIGGRLLYKFDDATNLSVVLFFPIINFLHLSIGTHEKTDRIIPNRDRDMLPSSKSIVLVVPDKNYLSHLKNLLEPDFLVHPINIAVWNPKYFVGLDPGVVIIGSSGKNDDVLEFCRALRKQDKFSDIPLLQLIERHDSAYKIQALKNGVTSFLVKPITREELALQIGKLVTGPAIPIVERQSPKQTAKNMALNEAFMDRIREVVENNISNTDFRVEDLCKALHMSHSKLHRKTVTASGMTPQQVIRQMRLDYATEQLNNPELNINEIALQAGFEDPGYFTRVFKREKGLTPTEWREEYGSSDKDFY